MGAGQILLAGVPVEPDAAEAQRWAEEELSKAIYHEEPGLIERFLTWLGDVLDGLSELGVNAPPSLAAVIVVAVFVAVVALALLLGGRVRARRRAAGGASHELFEDERDSAALTAAADAAARRSDWAAAVLERFRALVRSLDERGVLDDRAGMTAHEAAELGAAALPEQAGGLRWAGRLFDDVCYGHLTPGPAQDQNLRELTSAVAHARPEHGQVAHAGWAGVR